ncbi:MAG: response regulator transcription factor [Bacteroidota bacterium]
MNLILVDDSKHIRDSLKYLFVGVPDINCTATFENALTLNDSELAREAEVILMDIDMPGINGIEAVTQLRKAGWTTPIIMLTVFEDEQKIFAAIRAGADGYLLKNSRPEDIIKAVRDVRNGGASFTPQVAKKVLSYFQTPVKNEYNLTTREKEVLTQLVHGKVYKYIAQDMNITYETVRSHMKNIYRKIHVTSMSEAVAKAIREKIVD